MKQNTMSYYNVYEANIYSWHTPLTTPADLIIYQH